MSKKWTEQEDNLLKQLTAIGLSAKKIHEAYNEVLQGRTQVAINQRITYLNKPPEERKKEDQASMDNLDVLVAVIQKQNERLCNRLDNIARDLAEIKTQRSDNKIKLDDSAIRVLHEIKASEVQTASTTETIKREIQRALYRKEKKR